MSTRSDLKENVLATKVEGLLAWGMANRAPVLTVFGVAVVALLIGSVFVLRSHEKHDSDTTRLAVAQVLLSQHQDDRAYAALQDLRNTIQDNKMLAQTIYYQGVAALNLKKFDDAEKLFVEAIDRSANSPLKPLALSNLGFSQEAKNDYAAAVSTYERFMSEYGEHFLAPRVQLSLGRALAAENKIEEAKNSARAFDRFVSHIALGRKRTVNNGQVKDSVIQFQNLFNL